MFYHKYKNEQSMWMAQWHIYKIQGYIRSQKLHRSSAKLVLNTLFHHDLASGSSDVSFTEITNMAKYPAVSYQQKENYTVHQCSI